MVVPDKVRPDGLRGAGGPAWRTAQTTGLSPVYLAFDLLWAGGRPIIAQPLVTRREHLAKVVPPSAELVVVPGVVSDGLDLHLAVAQQGLPA